jgi:lipoprotein-releasing system ATP-binding protein
MTAPSTEASHPARSTETQARVVLEARNLVRTLGDRVKQTILHGINLEIRAGEFVALTGHSGSGKSTLLYLLGALDRPTSGQVTIDGVDASLLDDDARAGLRNLKLGFVFQFHFLLPEFSVLENVMIPMLRRGLPESTSRRRARETVQRLGLGDLERRRPNELSGGQQQRVSIARALAISIVETPRTSSTSSGLSIEKKA